MSQALLFLKGQGVDHKERSLDFILNSDDEYLEQEHDYIQWLFPLREPSYNVPESPVISSEEVMVAHESDVVQANLLRSLKRMEKFYLDNDHWLTVRDHNHLRLTRILKSIRLLHGLEPAESFYCVIMENVLASGVEVPEKTFAYWTDAVGLSFDKSNVIIRAD